MNLILLVSIILGVLFQSVSRKNCKSGAFSFSFVCSLTSAMFFVFTAAFKFSFNISLLPYVIAFAMSFGMATVGIFFAIKAGSLSLTSLANSYSLIIPCIYGLLFLKEMSSVFMYVGLVFLFLSFSLINVKKGDNKITALWVIYASMVFLGNGFCSTIQKMQQTLSCSGAHCRLLFDGFSDPVQATVSSISPAEDGRRAFVFRLLEGNKALLSLRFCSARLILPEESGMRVPAEALHQDEQGRSYVNISLDGASQRRLVDIIYTDAAGKWCLSALSTRADFLSEGDSIICG